MHPRLQPRVAFRTSSWVDDDSSSAVYRGAASGTFNAYQPRRPALRRAILDVILIVVTVAFFAVSVAYVHGCDRM